MTSTKFFSIAILAAVLAVPVVQANAAAGPPTDVTNSMQQAKQAAFRLSETADRLHAIARNGGHSWQSHSWYLDSAREDVNRLGKMLQELEDLKPVASETQQAGIARMRPHLIETSQRLFP